MEGEDKAAREKFEPITIDNASPRIGSGREVVNYVIGTDACNSGDVALVEALGVIGRGTERGPLLLCLSLSLRRSWSPQSLARSLGSRACFIDVLLVYILYRLRLECTFLLVLLGFF